MMVTMSSTMQWYKDPYLLEALDNENPPNHPHQEAIATFLQYVYMIGGSVSSIVSDDTDMDD